MSETELVSTAAPRKRGLSGMVLAELRQLAGELNIPDITGMRKGDLIAAIKERQAGASAAPQLALPDTAPAPARPGHHRERRCPCRAHPSSPRGQQARGRTGPEARPNGAAATVDAPTTTEASDADVSADDHTDHREPPPLLPPAPAQAGESTRESHRRRPPRARAVAVGSVSGAGPSTTAPRPSPPRPPTLATSTDAPTDGSADTGRPARGERRGGGDRTDNRRGGDRTDNRSDSRTDNRADNRADNRGGQPHRQPQ